MLLPATNAVSLTAAVSIYKTLIIRMLRAYSDKRSAA